MRYAHVIQRAKERYDLELTPQLIEGIETGIAAGQHHLLGKGDGHRSIYLVELAGATYPFIWDRVAKVIITVLPHYAMKQFRPRLKEYYGKKGKRLKHDSRHKKNRLKRKR